MTDRQPNPFAAPQVDRPAAPAGWYPDPFGLAVWRWFDGTSWTAFTGSGRPGSADTERRRPRLPKWLSPPVLTCGILTGLVMIVVAVSSPWAVLAGLVPLVIVLPVLRWLDRVEPEPRTSKVHAVLWGACVAVVIAAIANTIVALLFGEVAAMVISAPDPDETLARFSRFLGVAAKGRNLTLDRGGIEVMDETAATALTGRAVAPGRSAFVAVRVAVDDLDRVADFARKAGVRTRRDHGCLVAEFAIALGLGAWLFEQA